MAVDFPNTVVNYFLTGFQAFVNDGLLATDPLYLDTIVRGPLQDDPTKKAYYLTICPDYPKPGEERTSRPWRMPVSAMSRSGLGSGQDTPAPTVGGTFLYVTYFRMEGWMPSQGGFPAAYDMGGQALRRLERGWTMFAHDVLDAGLLMTDDEMETIAPHPNIFNFDGASFTTTGGGLTVFPRLYLKFHVFSQIDQRYQLGVS